MLHLSLSSFQFDECILTWMPLRIRKIWSHLRFNPGANNCSSLLLFLCLRWYVFWSSKFSAALISECITYLVLINGARAGSAGLTFLQFCNLNSFRIKFILGFSIFMGLSIPQYFNEYTAVNGYGPVHTRARWVWFNPTTFISLSKPFDNQSFSYKQKGLTVSFELSCFSSMTWSTCLSRPNRLLLDFWLCS